MEQMLQFPDGRTSRVFGYLETVGPKAGTFSDKLEDFDVDCDRASLDAARRELKASGDPYPCKRRHGEPRKSWLRRALWRFFRA